MRRIILLLLLGLLVGAAWHIGSRLSSDAVGMAVGLLFGVLAGVPAALMVMLAGRRRGADSEDVDESARRRALPGYGYGYGSPRQAPVIVLAAPPYGAGYPQPGGDARMLDPARALPGPPPNGEHRTFRVVGENEGIVDEW